MFILHNSLIYLKLIHFHFNINVWINSLVDFVISKILSSFLQKIEWYYLCREDHLDWSHRKTTQTFGGKARRSPLSNVRSLLSLRNELRFSIHSEWTSSSKIINYRFVNSPLTLSIIIRSIWGNKLSLHSIIHWKQCMDYWYVLSITAIDHLIELTNFVNP